MICSRYLFLIVVLAAVIAGVVSQVGGASQGLDEVLCQGSPATIVGTEGDDILYGTSGNDVIAALGGNDRIFGLDGDDRICGGEGNDGLSGDSGNNILDGGPGRDSLHPGPGEDEVYGGSGNDKLVGLGRVVNDGGEGIDQISFKRGPVVADLAEGTATVNGYTYTLVSIENMLGSNEADTLVGDDGKNKIIANKGDDTIQGGGGNDVLAGQVGDDSIVGGSGDDHLGGGFGSDTLNSQDGVSGNDVVDGGTHYPQPDIDTCIVDPGDTVQNCEA